VACNKAGAAWSIGENGVPFFKRPMMVVPILRCACQASRKKPARSRGQGIKKEKGETINKSPQAI